MKITNHNILIKGIFILISVVIFSYASFRSVVIGITHDEVFTYLMYVPLTIWETISYDPIYNANNHILNTLLMKVSTGLFGNAEWALRLPNTLGHLLYVIFSFRLVREFFPNVFMSLLAFVLLNANPYMLDFFSVARGYGLGMGIMMVSLYYFLKHLKSLQQKHLVICLLLAMLSVWSNFINLLYFAALVGVYGLIELEKYFTESSYSFSSLVRSQSASLAASCFLTLMIFVPLRQLKRLDEFRFGGESSFYKDTFERLTKNCLYNEKYLDGLTVPVFTKLILAFIIVNMVVLIWQRIREKSKWANHYGLVAGLFLLLIAMASIIQHHLMDVAYLQDRRAILFLPFAALLVSYGLERLWSVSAVTKVIAVALLVFSANHLIRSTDSYKATWEWYYDENTKEILELLQKDKSYTKEHPLELSVSWTMKNSFDFYQKTRALDWLAPMSYKTKDFATSGADYYYLFASEQAKVRDTTEKVFAENGRVLLKSTTPP